MFQSIKKFIPKAVLNSYPVHFIFAKYREIKCKKRLYQNNGACVSKKCLVYCVTESDNHAGMSDRLWAMIALWRTWSLYKEKDNCNLEFRALWDYPFDLRLFLEPNKYDWSIDRKDLSFDKKFATPIYVSNNHNEPNQVKSLRRALKPWTPQVHVRAIAHIERSRFGEYFHYLFKPSKLLQDALDEQFRVIGDKYVSVTFRFQQALGDFKEGNYMVLPEDKRMPLIQECLDLIKKIKKTHGDVSKVLVTSDSQTMLKYARELPYVYVIPGELVHMGYSEQGKDTAKHLKSFLDFMMIASAQEVYYAQVEGVHHSTFALTASKVNDRPYHQVDIALPK